MRNLPLGFSEVISLILGNSGLWSVLVELQVTDTESFLLCDAETPITYLGDTYEPYPINLSNILFAEQSTLKSLTLTISNITRELAPYLELADGLNGKEAYVYFYNDVADSAILQKYRVRASSLNTANIAFDLDFFGIVDSTFPGAYYNKNGCMWDFGGPECGLDITNVNIYNPPTDSPCTKKLEGTFGCRFWGDREAVFDPPRQHPTRFGGFPNLLNGDSLEV